MVFSTSRDAHGGETLLYLRKGISLKLLKVIEFEGNLHAMFVEINLKLVSAIFLKFIIHLTYILYNNLDEIAIANNVYLC